MSNVPHPVANILIGDDWEDVVTLEQMHAYAAAVSAAKDAEIERLRERVRVLEDALRGLMVGCKYCNIQGQWHWHEKAIASNEALDAARAALAARKGEAC